MLPYLYIWNAKAGKPWKHQIHKSQHNGFYIIWRNQPRKDKKKKMADGDEDDDKILLSQLPLLVRKDPLNAKYFKRKWNGHTHEYKPKIGLLSSAFREACNEGRVTVQQVCTKYSDEKYQLQKKLLECQSNNNNKRAKMEVPVGIAEPLSPTASPLAAANVQDYYNNANTTPDLELQRKYRELFPDRPVPDKSNELLRTISNLGVKQTAVDNATITGLASGHGYSLPLTNIRQHRIPKDKRYKGRERIVTDLADIQDRFKRVIKYWQTVRSGFTILDAQFRLARQDNSNMPVLLLDNLYSVLRVVDNVSVRMRKIKSDLLASGYTAFELSWADDDTNIPPKIPQAAECKNCIKVTAALKLDAKWVLDFGDKSTGLRVFPIHLQQIWQSLEFTTVLEFAVVGLELWLCTLLNLQKFNLFIDAIDLQEDKDALYLFATDIVIEMTWLKDVLAMILVLYLRAWSSPFMLQLAKTENLHFNTKSAGLVLLKNVSDPKQATLDWESIWQLDTLYGPLNSETEVPVLRNAIRTLSDHNVFIQSAYKTEPLDRILEFHSNDEVIAFVVIRSLESWFLVNTQWIESLSSSSSSLVKTAVTDRVKQIVNYMKGPLYVYLYAQEQRVPEDELKQQSTMDIEFQQALAVFDERYSAFSQSKITQGYSGGPELSAAALQTYSRLSDSLSILLKLLKTRFSEFTEQTPEVQLSRLLCLRAVENALYNRYIPAVEYLITTTKTI